MSHLHRRPCLPSWPARSQGLLLLLRPQSHPRIHGADGSLGLEELASHGSHWNTTAADGTESDDVTGYNQRSKLLSCASILLLHAGLTFRLVLRVAVFGANAYNRFDEQRMLSTS